MFWFRPLPWEYAVRNLLRRPGRSALTLLALALVILLIFVVVGFVRGLEATLSVSGDPNVVIVHSLGAAENLENSDIPLSIKGLLASREEVRVRARPNGSVAYVSAELYLGAQIGFQGEEEGALGLVRGVEPEVLLVRQRVQLLEGRWPGPGEVIVGRLAATKLGRAAEALRIGTTIAFEERSWQVVGTFAAAGSALEAEIWCPLYDLQLAMKRTTDQTVSIVAVMLAPGAQFADIDELCKERIQLELQATPETAYYQALERHYLPVRLLAWTLVVLLAGAGVFAGLNTMYGAVVGRVRELATLQAVGYARRAIALALMQEAFVLAAAGALLAALVALALLDGLAVRFTMGAFALRIDSIALLLGCGTGLLLGMVGALPPALHAMRLPIAEGLKAI